MAERYGFFDSIEGEDERYYTADEFAKFFNRVISTGILNGGENLQVVCTGSDMNVQIKTGCAWMLGYQYEIETDALNMPIDTADPAMDRIDRIVVRLDKRLENRYIKAFVLKGVPAETPIAPALTRDENVYEISLAQIKVIAGKSFIEQAEITDERLNDEVCGLANSLIKADPTEIFNQFNDYLTTYKTTKDAEYNTWETSKQQAYDSYIASIQSAWNTWFGSQQTEGFVMQSEKGAPGGVAELDLETGKVKPEQLPDMNYAELDEAKQVKDENLKNVKKLIFTGKSNAQLPANIPVSISGEGKVKRFAISPKYSPGYKAATDAIQINTNTYQYNGDLLPLENDRFLYAHFYTTQSILFCGCGRVYFDEAANEQKVENIQGYTVNSYAYYPSGCRFIRLEDDRLLIVYVKYDNGAYKLLGRLFALNIEGNSSNTLSFLSDIDFGVLLRDVKFVEVDGRFIVAGQHGNRSEVVFYEISIDENDNVSILEIGSLSNTLLSDSVFDMKYGLENNTFILEYYLSSPRGVYLRKCTLGETSIDFGNPFTVTTLAVSSYRADRDRFIVLQPGIIALVYTYNGYPYMRIINFNTLSMSTLRYVGDLSGGNHTLLQINNRELLLTETQTSSPYTKRWRCVKLIYTENTVTDINFVGSYYNSPVAGSGIPNYRVVKGSYLFSLHPNTTNGALQFRAFPFDFSLNFLGILQNDVEVDSTAYVAIEGFVALSNVSSIPGSAICLSIYGEFKNQDDLTSGEKASGEFIEVGKFIDFSGTALIKSSL
ncbi:hypothetical protein SAMN02745945_01829 [Peptoclostridium litorale DSM 5388]|uniref:Putative tail protein n=1 Tax=Peptoclostridium litorale DSM 5388 TaxID=1121324 RepID=A0A069RNZ4_PEPLI|nr:hypothetical protein [Peptoclostridium litorale]KDR95897.1 putative tail protein [Peptoclostridium litorale DSM 5388]SIO10439.1 hypothetical protein SAMN02745945_01829 [Peptoclostridium litorale DSM 5388]